MCKILKVTNTDYFETDAFENYTFNMFMLICVTRCSTVFNYHYCNDTISQTDLASGVVVVENTERDCGQNAGEIQEKRRRYGLV